MSQNPEAIKGKINKLDFIKMRSVCIKKTNDNNKTHHKQSHDTGKKATKGKIATQQIKGEFP